MITAGEKIDNTFAMKEYQIAPYDGKVVDMKPARRTFSDWNKEKGNSFIDFYTKKKAFLPAPSHYKDVANGYLEKPRAPKLYSAQRNTIMSAIIKKAAKSPHGPGSFNPKLPQEKVLGTYVSQERVTMAQSIMISAGSTPASNIGHQQQREPAAAATGNSGSHQQRQ